MDIVFGRTGGKEKVLVRFFFYSIRIVWFGGRSTFSFSVCEFASSENQGNIGAQILFHWP
jgi:hypothetical protein